ncbi:MAG: carboxypeptidase-like regulatory domain-containing protein, partial [Xanthomarina gelatinilytica]|nr:carboxypeptidase-like regulatory domain-containing protein [Xanthomarina gelatinilytica]
MFLFSMSFLGFSQSGTLKGVILDDANNPIPNVNIKAQDKGTVTNENGFFILKIPADQEVTVVFSHLTFESITATFNLKNGEEYEFHPIMKESVEQISTVVISSKQRKEVEGIITLEPETVRLIPGANAG